jgi:hypothetical protein
MAIVAVAIGSKRFNNSRRIIYGRCVTFLSPSKGAPCARSSLNNLYFSVLINQKVLTVSF